ncbi:MAG TPA: arsenate reductase (glutaredoxin) [Gammaproteobacteria bacterium]|nr:arsenate reductase (glutaredoxin) [Gammaproteobacteria bacterium]
MSDIQILHNPRCSKSRATKQILDDKGLAYKVVDYLKQPPTRDELEEILRLLQMEPRALMRRGESVYREQQLDDEGLSRDDLIQAMLDHPILIERPIVLANGKASLGRPPEQVLDILP